MSKKSTASLMINALVPVLMLFYPIFITYAIINHLENILFTYNDIMKFRNDYLGSQNVVLTGTNYKNLGTVVESGLVKLSDINLKKFNLDMQANKDSQEYTTSTTLDKTEMYNFTNPYYSMLLQGNTDTNKDVTLPSLSSLLQDSSIKNDFNGIYAPIQLELSIDTVNAPNQLIQKKYADVGLIYYTSKELVKYNVTIPNDHWGYDANGTLTYISDNITEEHSYYRPIQGTWVDNFTFVPNDPSKTGSWIWNDTIVEQPSSFNITLTINGRSENATFSLEKAKNDVTTYKTIIPVSTRNQLNLQFDISQLTIELDKSNIMDSTFDENQYNNLLSKTIIFNNYTYYYKNGAPGFSSTYPDGYAVDDYGEPIGAIRVNDTLLRDRIEIYNISQF